MSQRGPRRPLTARLALAATLALRACCLPARWLECRPQRVLSVSDSLGLGHVTRCRARVNPSGGGRVRLRLGLDPVRLFAEPQRTPFAKALQIRAFSARHQLLKLRVKLGCERSQRFPTQPLYLVGLARRID